MKKKYCLLPFPGIMLLLMIPYCLFIGISAVYGQSPNLVLNPGFEDYLICPKSHTTFNASHKFLPNWTFPTRATPDYFNRCSTGDVRVPKNFAGVSEPKAGNGYIGIILSGSKESYREYIQGELKTPLEPNKRYCVFFHYKLASYSRFAVDQLSFYFENEEIKDSEKQRNISVTPQITNQSGLFLDNIDEWERICTLYTAKGGEKYFIIGNFKNYENTNYVVTDKTVVNLRNKEYAYYYIDEVNVIPLDDCLNCPCVKKDMEVFIKDTFYTGGVNPYTGRIDRIINDGRISVAVRGGSPPYSITWSNGARGYDLKQLPAGRYTYTVKDKMNCTATGTIVFKKPVLPEDEFLAGLKNIEEGSAIVLENIFFEFNKTQLLPESYMELNRIVDFMRETGIRKIEISGHTDNKGSESYNQKLSEGRAKSVVDYLISQGIGAERLAWVGYGMSKPIETNSTEEGRAVNRRVEFKLLKK